MNYKSYSASIIYILYIQMTILMLILHPLACTHEYMHREKHVRRIEQFLIAMTTYLQGGAKRKSSNLQHDSYLVFEGVATTLEYHSK